MPPFLSLQCPPSPSSLKFVSVTKNAYPLQAIFAEIMSFHPILITNLLALLVLVIWLYLAFLRGNFWRLEEDHLEPKPLEKWPHVVAIVPARNEAATIARAVTSLLGQDYPGEFEIIVVDDHSDDGTAALARKAAEETGAAARITIHSAAELPQGWTGKLWALNEGISATSGEAPDIFWFTDADIVHAPDTLRRLVTRAETESLDLASLMVLLQAKTFPEKLLIPPFLYFFLMLYPPRWIAEPQKQTAGAAGGCILLRRSALERIGGLASIRNDLIDRTAFTQLRYSSLLLVATLLGLFVTYWLPWILFFAGEDPAWLLGSTAASLMTVTFLFTVKFYNRSALWALTPPFAAAFYGYATFLSAVRYWLGRGAQWKGRSQAPKGLGSSQVPHDS